MPTPLAKLLEHYAAGVFTDAEFITRYVACITEADASEAISALPLQMRLAVQEFVENSPTSELDWQGLFVVESDCSTETPEEKNLRRAVMQRNTRIGVEALRAWFKATGLSHGENRDSR